MYKDRSRRVLQPVGHGENVDFYHSAQVTPLVPQYDQVKQHTVSWGNRFSQLGKGDDVGSPFKTSKTWVQRNSEVYDIWGLGSRYIGTLHCGAAWFTGAEPFVANSSISVLDAAGARAISRTIPTNPITSGAVALGELRKDGIPHMLGSSLLRDRTKHLMKTSGDEYLNVEFGWKPLISDLRNFAKSVKDHKKIIDQLQSDSGKNVRRRLVLAQTSDITPPDGPKWSNLTAFKADGSNLNAWESYLPPNPGFKTWSSTDRKLWFSGCYTYTLPNPDKGILDRMAYYEACANKLYGTRLTPEVVWNLAPWSWAADWFGDTGSILHNWSQLGADGLVLRYGYLMEEIKQSSFCSFHGGYHTTPDRLNPRIIDIVESNGSTSKIRTAATPFGFGVDFTSLTGRQISIMGALGMSNAPRVHL